MLLARSGTDYHGWIGYWGPWFPNNLALFDGETVTKQTYGNGGGTPEQFTAGGPGSYIRWVPEFTIPDGSVATSGVTSYYVKALELEQRMKAVAGSVCASAGLTTTSYASQLPTLGDWTAPGIGAEPVVSGPPAVLGGVLQ